MQESDVFELAPGCAWNSVSGSWKSLAVLGLGFPGYPGNSMYIRVENISVYDMLSSVLRIAKIGGISQSPMLQARIVDGVWFNPDYDPFFIQGANRVSGHIPPGEQCAVEIRAYPDNNATADDNPVTVDISVWSLEV
jgi:hypothetical protein